MSDAVFRIPHPVNEPVRPYAPGDATRTQIKARLKSMAAEKIEIPETAARLISKGFSRGVMPDNIVPFTARRVAGRLEETEGPATTPQRAIDYLSDACPTCGHFTLRPDDGVAVCEACGATVQTA